MTETSKLSQEIAAKCAKEMVANGTPENIAQAIVAAWSEQLAPIISEAIAPLRPIWKCFHCEFETSDRAEAEAHFGERDDAEEFKPICKWWQLMKEDERITTLQDVCQQLNYERMESYKENKRAEAAEAQLSSLSRERDELREWKESAMKLLPMQEWGEALGLRLGSSIHEAILPALQRLSSLSLAVKELCDAVSEVAQKSIGLGPEGVTKMRELLAAAERARTLVKP